jgi:hypothetical protein
MISTNDVGEMPAVRAVTGLSLAVRGWAAWAPGRETATAWRAWAGAAKAAEADPPAAEGASVTLPMMLRRRATPLGQKVIGSALALESAVRDGRYVFASRHGEMSRTIRILSDMAAGDTPSPAEFSMCVHHGLAGLLSIHTGNRKGHTALAAGADSFGYGLLEAAACLAENPDEPVLLIYGDEPLPEPYDPFRDQHETALPVTLALALGPPDQGGDTIMVSAAARERQNQAADCVVSSFLRFLLSGRHSAAGLGGRMQWNWSRTAHAT